MYSLQGFTKSVQPAMRPQKTFSKTSKPLGANVNKLNIEQTSKLYTGKQLYNHTPMKNDSSKIMNRKYEGSTPVLDSCTNSSNFIPNQVGNNSSSLANNTQNNNSNSYLNKSYNQYVTQDGSFPHYTLMSYTNSNNNVMNNTSLYANVNVSGSVPQETIRQDANNIFDDIDSYAFQTFPSYFNPRTATNMPHGEKVNKWIENVPVFNVSGDLWESDCYSINDNVDWEEEEFDFGLAHKHEHFSFSLATADEVLYLQAKRVDTLVRKMYALSSEVPLDDSR